MTPEYIVLHHSGTQDSRTVSWGAIAKYHTKVLGWSDNGYHFGIELVNDRYEVLVGRSPLKKGAHCKHANMNSRSLGVCVVGDWDDYPPSESQLDKTEMLVRWLIQVYNILPQHLIGHRDAGLLDGYDWTKGEFKTCPGKMFDVDEFRQRL